MNKDSLGINILLLLLTAVGLMPGGSVYKDKIHEHPQYNTVQYKYMNITKHKKQKIQKNTENT
jgi:hypothetical protein